MRFDVAVFDAGGMSLSMSSLRSLIVVVTGFSTMGNCGLAFRPVGSNPPQQNGAAPTTPPRATSTPYAGDLSIFEYPGRDKKLEIDRVMDLLHITQGKAVADLGAGSGWFTVRAAQRVGPHGTVYAEDISPASIQYITDRGKREKLENIRTVLDKIGTLDLPPTSVDAVLMLKAYHEFAAPVALMKLLRGSLRPGARVGIIDRNGNGSGTDHGVTQETVEREMVEAGYRKVGMYDFTKKDGQDYFLIFEVK